jgi:Leucine-rich repeat (LRR) protein
MKTILLFVICILFGLSFACIYNESDKFALEMLYNSTNGQDWSNNKNWIITNDYCHWYGISCDINCNVSRISLVRNNLTGYLPNFSSGTLGSLTYINLANNNIYGNIGTLYNIQNLEAIDVSINSIKEEIDPLVFSSMTKLIYINFSQNQFYGQIPELSPVVQTLYLWKNILTGQFPIINQSANYSIIIMDLSHNKIHGNLPNNFDRLIRLETLQINHNNFTGILPDSLHLTNLTMIDLSNNHFIGSIPKSYANLINLESFFANNNELSDGLDVVYWMMKLSAIEIINNNFEEIREDFLMSSLQVFLASNNSLNGVLHVTYATNLLVVDISLNKNLTANIDKINYDDFHLMSDPQYYDNYICQNVLLWKTLYITDPKFFNYVNCKKIQIYLSTN